MKDDSFHFPNLGFIRKLPRSLQGLCCTDLVVAIAVAVALSLVLLLGSKCGKLMCSLLGKVLELYEQPSLTKP